jgi:6,7-dimethyl-8-ribityllumazine synthase
MATKLKNLSSYDPAKVPSSKGMTFGLVVSEWNESVTASLAQGAYDTLLQHGTLPEDIFVHTVPGSFELPSGGQFLFEAKGPDAVILIGCVIQGETRHFEFICNAVAQGCKDLALKYGKPAIFGVLTTETTQQAIDRSGGKHGNKGIEAAVTAIKMIALRERLASGD